MQRSSGGSRPQAVGNRRNYTRNSNAAFKFHNFVFNEDNQSFCLEEQHGNKKITVLHWKKSEVEKSGSGSSGGTGEGALLPEETELEETNTTDSPPEIVTYGQAGKTISRQLSKTSSDSTSATKRRTHEVTTSASFPPLSSHSSNRNAAVSTLTSSSAVPPLLSSPPPEAAASTPPLPSVTSSHHHPLQHLISPSTSILSPSSHFSQPLPGDCPSPHLSSRLRYHPLSKSTASSSSITTSSSNSSSSAVAANWLHQSLHDLDLTELPYRSTFRLPNLNCRRKPTQVRRTVVDEDDDDIDDDEESDRSDDELSDQEMMAGDDSNLFCTYRRYLEQFDRKEQTQPLDLSVKNVIVDDNNNNTTTSRKPMATHPWNIDSILGLKSPQSSFIKSESIDEMDRAFQSNRSEALSPSAMISSVKCCSPPAAAEHYRAPTSSSSRKSTVNPFMLPSCSNDASVFSPYSTKAPASRRHERADELRRHPSSSLYLFDAFLEEEISRLLQQTNAKSPPSSTASTSTSSPGIFHHPRTATTASTSTKAITTPRDEYEDIEERIEDKLRSLHREVLTRKAALERKSRFGGDSDAGSAGQEHLKLHFKLDAARNGSLELYGTDGAKSNRTLSETNLNQQFSLPFSSKGRPPSSQRNQIKRQLEDAFKQNGFLVKTKQVSDANNMAMFCKFRQLRKYTRYYLKSWQNHLPEEVNKLWKGFLPPKTERPLQQQQQLLFHHHFEPSTSSVALSSWESSSSFSN